jgi:hypothetical protein
MLFLRALRVSVVNGFYGRRKLYRLYFNSDVQLGQRLALTGMAV